MFNSEIRKIVGNRMRTRRKELKLSLQYVADKLEVSASTVQRYESGTIDNTKKLVIESVAEVLHVTPEWLRAETDMIESDYSDPALAKIEDLFQELIADYPLQVDDPTASEFSRDLLLYLLMVMKRFNKQFVFAIRQYSSGNEKFAKALEMDSPEEFNNTMFHREITRSINDLKEVVETLDDYASNKDYCKRHIKSMISDINVLLSEKEPDEQ